MKKKIAIVLSMGILGCNILTAQVSNYTFTQSVTSYGAPNTGSLVGGKFQDDDVNTVSLPFNFTYNGTSYNNINVCSNGYLSFNNLSGFEYFAISDMTTTEVISAFGEDLFMGTILKGDITTGSNIITNLSSMVGVQVGDTIFDWNTDFPSNPVITNIVGNTLILNVSALNTITGYDIFLDNGSIVQSVTGVAPNRVVEFDFRNFTHYFTHDEMLNFKIRLYETSNKIEFLYGTFAPAVFLSPCEVGLKGNATDFNSRLVNSQNTWSTSVASIIITDACDFSMTKYPNIGLSYAWSTMPCNIPTLSVSQPSSMICEGQTAIISASGAATYSWSNGSTSAQITVTPSATTMYTLTGFNGACSNTLSITQSVTALPNLTVSQTHTQICAGQSTTLTVNGAASYSWFPSGNGSTTSNFVVSPGTTTTYTVMGANNNCSNSKTLTLNVGACAGVDSRLLSENNISIYPNPFKSTLKLKGYDSEVKVTITDALGNILLNSTIPAGETASLNTESFIPGLYLISVSDKNQTIVKKAVKQ
jgi:hypothetical protein